MILLISYYIWIHTNIKQSESIYLLLQSETEDVKIVFDLVYAPI